MKFFTKYILGIIILIQIISHVRQIQITRSKCKSLQKETDKPQSKEAMTDEAYTNHIMHIYLSSVFSHSDKIKKETLTKEQLRVLITGFYIAKHVKDGLNLPLECVDSPYDDHCRQNKMKNFSITMYRDHVETDKVSRLLYSIVRKDAVKDAISESFLLKVCIPPGTFGEPYPTFNCVDRPCNYSLDHKDGVNCADYTI